MHGCVIFMKISWHVMQLNKKFQVFRDESLPSLKKNQSKRYLIQLRLPDFHYDQVKVTEVTTTLLNEAAHLDPMIIEIVS